MPAGTRPIRVAFLLQVAIAGLVIVLCMLGLAAANDRLPNPAPTLVAMAIALLALTGVSWLTYRATKRALAPMNWLLTRVQRWDPRRPDIDGLQDDIPHFVQGPTRQLVEALQALSGRMNAYVARERDFTRDASHELRTPLTVIRVASDLIAQDEGLSAHSRRSLRRIQGANAQMESLMDALLLLARDEHVVLETEEFAVREVVEHELERVRPLVEGRGLELALQVDAEPRIHAPPRVLGVMLGNLLSNAARFTDRGRISVRLAADRVEVVDTGIGMDAAELARAFEPFYRANIEQPVGPGLGLSIAHRLGQRCHWPLQLASTPGEGTRATILFGAGLRHD